MCGLSVCLCVWPKCVSGLSVCVFCQCVYVCTQVSPKCVVSVCVWPKCM